MKKTHLWFIVWCLAGLSVLCSAFQDVYANIQSTQKVDNVMVILDASSSMADLYNEKEKMVLAKDTITLMNSYIPETTRMAGLRIFTRKHFFSGTETDLVYGLSEYSKDKFANALNGVEKAKGNSPLGLAIDAATEDLLPTNGTIAVIIFSDGADMDTAPIEAAAMMKEKLGERVCIYTVLIGNDEKGGECMARVAQQGKCGFMVNADVISSVKGMEPFVQKIFLASGAVEVKTLPVKVQTKIPVKVSADSDNDGVNDSLDQCPATPKGVKVDGKGCSVFQFESILFDPGTYEINTQAQVVLDGVVRVLDKVIGLKMEIQGHTDNLGSEKDNKNLSKKRAEAVKEYLVEKGIDSGRLTCVGYGSSKPVASNNTSEGRSMNRRVTFRPLL